MKKNIISILLLLFSVSAVAQNQMISQEVIVENSYRFYAQAHINGTFSSSEDLRYNKIYKPLCWGADVAVGYNFNDFWGLFAEFAYNKNKAASQIQENPMNNQNIYTFNSFEPSINVTYNLSNGFSGYKPGRRNNFYINVGPSVAIRPKIDVPNNYYRVQEDGTTDKANFDAKTLIGGHMSLSYVYNYSNWVAFTAHAGVAFYGDKFSGHAWEVKLDSRANIGLGVRVFLNKSPKPVREIEYRDRVIVKHDTVKVREEVDIRDVDVYPIPFETNKSDLASAKTADLKTVADILSKNPEAVVYVLGYANKDTEAANQAKLAVERADIITDELINKYGVDETRVITHKIGTQDQPYLKQAEKNQATICIITNLKHF